MIPVLLFPAFDPVLVRFGPFAIRWYALAYIVGLVLGGRIGYVLFYQPLFYLQHPAAALAVWQGGMSFHGGMLGVAAAIVWFCRHERISILGFADRIAVCA